MPEGFLTSRPGSASPPLILYLFEVSVPEVLVAGVERIVIPG